MVYVLVHGGGFGASCWDLLTPQLAGPVIAVDLPGRGQRPADLTAVTIADFVAAVVDEIVGTDQHDVVLVGHSLAGVTLPGVVGAVPGRLRHVVFVSAAVPPDGGRVIDTLDPGMREYAEQAGADAGASGTLDPELAAAVFCNDMDAVLTQYTIDRLVPEASRVIFEPVSLAGMRAPVPRTYVGLSRDAIVEPRRQEEMVANLRSIEGGEPPVAPLATVEIDAGHMVMISRPEALAEFLRSV
jgi:pimeloyl-ACP methyl ester carboxylesterase